MKRRHLTPPAKPIVLVSKQETARQIVRRNPDITAKQIMQATGLHDRQARLAISQIRRENGQRVTPRQRFPTPLRKAIIKPDIPALVARAGSGSV